MTSTDPSSQIIIESFLRGVGFDKLASKLPVVSRPVIAWAWMFVIVDVVVLQSYKELMGYKATFLVNPAWLISPLFVLFAANATVYLYDRYDRALELMDFEQRTSSPERFQRLAPSWIRLCLYIFGAVYAVFNVYNLGFKLMLETGGIAEVIGTAVVLPFGYVPIFVEFLTVYVGITIFLPRKIKESDFVVHFLDPEGLGGLRPVGELIKLTYYFIMIGLVGFLLFTYGPYIFGEIVQNPYPEPDIIINAAFTAVWLLAVAMLAYGLFVIHLFLKREKEEELARLDEQAQNVIKNPFDVHSWEVEDEEALQDIRERMNHVNRTKEYPTTFAMWSQILLGLILPQVVQVVMTLYP